MEELNVCPLCGTEYDPDEEFHAYQAINEYGKCTDCIGYCPYVMDDLERIVSRDIPVVFDVIPAPEETFQKREVVLWDQALEDGLDELGFELKPMGLEKDDRIPYFGLYTKHGMFVHVYEVHEYNGDNFFDFGDPADKKFLRESKESMKL